MKKFIPILLLINIAFCGCRKSIDPATYHNLMISVVEGPIKVQVSKSYTYELQSRFADFETLLSFQNKKIVKDSFLKRKRLYDTDLKFKLRIYPTEKKDHVLKYKLDYKEEYFERIQYFSSAIVHDFVLISEKDTTFPINSLFERSYGLTPYIDVLFAFNKVTKPKKIVFFDRMLSKQEVEFDITEIVQESNYPKLKL